MLKKEKVIFHTSHHNCYTNPTPQTVCIQTSDVQPDVVCVTVLLRAQLTAVCTLISRPHILNGKGPFRGPLVEVDADSRVRSKLKEADRQRMYVITLPPRHLL